MTLTQLDRASVRRLTDEAERALEAVAEKYGMALKRGTGSYSLDRLTVKFDFAVTTESGAPADFAGKASRLGLPEDCYGAAFTSGGTTYTVIEINLRRPKYPVSAEGPQGGRYKFTADTVLRGLRP
jgi:hypothetical protein